MEKGKMIYTGLCCKVNTKAAFIDMCMRLPSLESKLLMSSAALSTGCEKQICGLARDPKTGILEVQVKLDEEKQEQIYEEVIGRRLREGKLVQIPEFDMRMLKPIEMMHQKEMNIDVIPFIVYAIVRNSRSRELLLSSVSGCEGEYLAEFPLAADAGKKRPKNNVDADVERFILCRRKGCARINHIK